ncbi:MAG TPA: GTPase Era [Gammaproteobacteria bacterium]|nr:GTPase Era [Gammaproteobacteria bacterium]
MSDSGHRCGFIAIVGRPNVGKSTLLNRILGQKISITSSKPQTTRHRILGIRSGERLQAIYVDTPGIHLQAKSAMNRYLNRVASASLQDVDLILFMVEALRWGTEDELVLERIRQAKAPVILLVNKVDRVTDKSRLLPYLQELGGRYGFEEVLPISATRRSDLLRVEEVVERLLPQQPPVFPPEQITDRSERFLAAEIVREKLMRRLGQELPYGLTVEIERFRRRGNGLVEIGAVIWVERSSHKGMVIGRDGGQLKKVGAQARRDMERLLDSRVFLQLWVKVKEGWSDDERALRSLGYSDEG